MDRLDDDARPVTGYAEHISLLEAVRNELAESYCKAIGLPMDLADGRPWVRTHDEAHDPLVWGVGGRCSHEDCDRDGTARAGSRLTGILNAPGVEPFTGGDRG